MGRKARLKQTRAIDPRPVLAIEHLDWSKRDWTIIALLFAITFAVFGQVASHSFLNFDDGQFISENPHVLNGDIAWALTSAEIGWYPLTWLSHMLDVRLWGMRAGMHLLTGVFLHAISTILLFLALRRLTRAAWPSAFVAALFAIHPMHVESVAWASERKDTLSTLFAMLALWLYARAPRSMAGVSIALALSLAAKQMYITLPFVLLLLDAWPFHRLSTLGDLRSRIVEKWPLFVLTVAGIAAAFIGQRNLNAMQSTTARPMVDRIANALIAYVRYLGKLFVPVDMALPYPLTRVTLVEAVVPFFVLAAITMAVLAARRSAPYLAVGWLWFLGTLVPVIGIVAIGSQSMADRYTYVSYVGLFIAIAFGVVDLARRIRIPDKALAVIAGIAVVSYAIVAMHQVRYWKDSETLFSHTLAVTRNNPDAEYNLGQTMQATKPDEAMPHLRRAIALMQSVLMLPGATKPAWYSQAYVGLGTAMLMKARPLAQSPARDALIQDAVANYRQALALDPNAPHAKHNIEVAAQMMPRKPVVTGALQSDYDAYLNEGTVLSQQGHFVEAVDEFRQAVAIAPRATEARIYLALGLIQANRRPDGVAELQAAKAIDAVEANEILTKALHMPVGDGNLDAFIEQASR
jgi:hypothetical protein